MPKSVYPNPFEARVLAGEAPGGEPASVSLVAPTVVACGEPFRLKVAVLDADGYPSVQCGETVKISGAFADPKAMEIAFKKGRPAVGAVEGVAVREAGVFRFEASMGKSAWPSNPVACSEEPSERVWWGDPHVHTALSGCHADLCRSLNFCYVAARHVAGLDWVSAADHVSNGRCELARWKDQRATCDAFDDPPGFATLHGYEASLPGGKGGDNNVYLLEPPAMFVDEYEEGDLKSLCAKLAAEVGEDDFLVVPHHTTRFKKHGEIPDEIYPGESLMPALEIHSKWGTSEYRGNPNPLQKVHDGPSYAADFLARGMRFGFMAGTDTHATMPSGGGEEPGHIDRLPGFTAAIAPALGRKQVFDALRGRRCYAASGGRIYLDAQLDGEPFGAVVPFVPQRPRRLRATAAAPWDIASVEVVRNGAVVYREDPGEWKASIEYVDQEDIAVCGLDAPDMGKFIYYYVRVTCASGAQAWSSPWWVTANGE